MTIIANNNDLGGMVYPFLQPFPEWRIETRAISEPCNADQQPTLRWVKDDKVCDLFIPGMDANQFLAYTGLGNQRPQAGRAPGQCLAMARPRRGNDLVTEVVSGALVVGPGVAEPYDQAHRVIRCLRLRCPRTQQPLQRPLHLLHPQQAPHPREDRRPRARALRSRPPGR